VRTRPRWRELPAAQQPNCDGVALREVARALADVPPLVVPSEVDQRRERLAGCGEPLLLHLDPAQAIVGLAKQLDADLVDVGKRACRARSGSLSAASRIRSRTTRRASCSSSRPAS
jgi:hypothetical protein